MVFSKMYGNTVSITVFAYIFTVLAYSGESAEPSLTVIHVATDETRGSVVRSTKKGGRNPIMSHLRRNSGVRIISALN